METLDDRAQRVQDRLREAGDEEAAELIDELYGLLPEPAAKKGRWQDDGDRSIRVLQSDGTFKTVKKTNAHRVAGAKAKGHAPR